MLLLVSGASGVGKSTARVGAARLLDGRFEAVEFGMLAEIPAVPTIEWRHRMVELAVQRAARLDAEGRHLLLAGDSVPAGEALAAPSADEVDTAVCLLDADEASQRARLAARQDPEEWLPANLGFAEWMRHHAVNPSHVPEAIMQDAWPEMRWERFVGRGPGPEWRMSIVDTSALAPNEVAASLADWAREAVAGRAPVFRRGWHLG